MWQTNVNSGLLPLYFRSQYVSTLLHVTSMNTRLSVLQRNINDLNATSQQSEENQGCKGCKCNLVNSLIPALLAFATLHYYLQV